MSSSISILATGCGDFTKAALLERINGFVDRMGRPFDVWFCFLRTGALEDFSLLLERPENYCSKLYLVSPSKQAPPTEELPPQTRDCCTMLRPGAIECFKGLNFLHWDPTMLSLELKEPDLDLVLSFAWPQGIENNSKSLPTSSPSLLESAELAHFMQKNPSRYTIVAGSNVFYEREAFEARHDDKSTFCRFISLANFGSEHKGHYAFKINPSVAGDSLKRPANLTTSPFIARESAQDEVVPPNFEPAQPSRRPYICRICNEPGHHIKECPMRVKKPRCLNISECWFCLRNDASKKHLVIDVAEEIYFALARGGLEDDHFLIIPIEHVSALGPLSPRLQTDIQAAKKRAETSFKKYGKIPVFFSVFQNSDHHWHLHCVPVSKDLAGSFWGNMDDFFERRGYPLTPESSPPESCHFFIECKGETRFHHFSPKDFFPSQIGIEALAHLLKVRRDRDWRKNVASEDVESGQVRRLREIL